jgi:hypothetical protein
MCEKKLLGFGRIHSDLLGWLEGGRVMPAVADRGVRSQGSSKNWCK